MSTPHRIIANTLRHIATLATAAGMTLAAGQAAAAPGTLADIPVFLQQPVQSNIMILTDDSGSMDWEVMIRASGTGSQGGSGWIDLSPDNSTERLELCAGYNALMYNPNVTYTPWVGTDEGGVAYADQSVTAARENPYLANPENNCNSGNGDQGDNNGYCNLLTQVGPQGSSDPQSIRGAFYYPWNDADNDEEYDNGECPTASENRVYVSTLSDAQKTNFANWYSYYRKREYVAKRALSEVISESKQRIGLSTINRNNGITRNYGVQPPYGSAYRDPQEVGTEIADVDDISVPLDTSAADNKFKLMRNLFRINSNSGTPLRSGLNNVGKYFSAADSTGTNLFGFSASDETPILSASDGGECQQNFAVVMSDGYWNTDSGDEWSTTTGSSGVGNTDTDGTGDWDGQSYADTYRNTLADVAMKWYETDLDTTLTGKVPSSNIGSSADQDDNTEQHMVTFTVAFGLSGNTSCNPTDRTTSVASQNWPEICDNPSASSGSGWPNPVADSATTIDDMRHAAWNGRGQFLSAGDPQDLIDSLLEAFSDIDNRNTAAAAAVAVNSTNLGAGGLVYQASFDSSSWSGNVKAFAYDSNTQAFSNTASFAVASKLEDQVSGANSAPARQIITFNGTQGVPLTFPGDGGVLNYLIYLTTNLLGTSSYLSQTQVRDLLSDAPYDYDNLVTNILNVLFASARQANFEHGVKIIDWLRGDRSNEDDDTGLRERDSGDLLGDIVNSAPLYVGNPAANKYPDTIEPSPAPAYSSYVTATNRTAMVYIGANDGALHGVDATTGYEKFAYFPGMLFSAGGYVSALSSPDYEHKYYVDGSPTAADAYIDFDGNSSDEWGTALVGSLRAGGKGIFAMNITNPANFSEANAASMVMWEITNTASGYEALGYTFARPTIAKLHNGKWGVIFGNGYNNTSNGRAVLYIADLEDGSLIKAIDTGVGSVANSNCADGSSDCNGLSTPAVVDFNFDGVADRVYAGDVHGNLWAFDISTVSTGSWASIGGSSPLFRARNDADAKQPITTQPAVAFHPTERGSATTPNLLVFFGTGEFVSSTAKSNTDTQTMYAVWDRGPASGNPLTAKSLPIVRSNLVEQTISLSSVDPDGGGTDPANDVRLLTREAVNYQDKSGWYVDLTTSSERVIVSPLILGEVVAWVTAIPQGTLCDSAGKSWVMAADLLTGGEPDFVVFDVDGNGSFDNDQTDAGENPAGVYSADLYWQPTALGGLTTAYDQTSSSSSSGSSSGASGSSGSGSSSGGSSGGASACSGTGAGAGKVVISKDDSSGSGPALDTKDIQYQAGLCTRTSWTHVGY